MANNLLDFVETTIFEHQNEQLKFAEKDLLLFRIQEDLLEDPERGDLIEGTGGARKARVADPLTSGGKSGGYRYLYLYLEHKGRIYLLYLFKKNQQANLSSAQKKSGQGVGSGNKTRLSRERQKRMCVVKKKYMSDEDFALLEASLKEALEFETGKRKDLRVTSLPPRPRPLTRVEIAQIRGGLDASQAVFAHLLNISVKTVRAWESGIRKPSDASLKLLTIAKEYPQVLLAGVSTAPEKAKKSRRKKATREKAL